MELTFKEKNYLINLLDGELQYYLDINHELYYTFIDKLKTKIEKVRVR